jgi:23S rRNA pseudouridine1911/1915/1917 synthase
MANLNVSRAERLDMRVIAMYPDLTRSVAAKLIEQGKVTVNGKVVTKAGSKLKPGDDIHADYNYELMTAIPSIDIPVLYEDDDCVVVEKPVGILTHSKGDFNPEATVASWLAEHLVKAGQKPLWLLERDVESGSPNNPRAGIVHRLDRATSGVMICAKTPAALAHLQKQFSQRKTKKIYTAIISGHLKHQHAIIDMPIERNPKKPKTFHVSAGGKPSVTEYQVTMSSNKYDLVELKPATGRTHQLRVHLHHQGHPIVGDTFYGGPEAPRLFLHAHSLEITLPNKQRKTFTTPVPNEFNELMSKS